MGRAFLIFLCLSVVVLASCKRSASIKPGYFDSLVVHQIDLLEASKATLVKKAILGPSHGEVTLTPARKVWETELDVFRQLDAFEKPAYRSLYTVSDGSKDPGSNLSIRSYSTTAIIPVRSLKFYYHRHFANLKKIEAVYAEQNSLYTGQRKLSLEFDEVKGRVMLSGYHMEGIQKMVLGDTINFSINGAIGY